MMNLIQTIGKSLSFLFIFSFMTNGLPAFSGNTSLSETSLFLLQQKKEKKKKKEDKNLPSSSKDMETHVKVEQMPTFTKGSPNMWVAKNVKYPLYAMQRKIEGKVYVGFIINQDGSISDVKIVRGVHPSLDKEAVRVIKSMPHWNPGKIKGKAVRVYHTLPINFRLLH